MALFAQTHRQHLSACGTGAGCDWRCQKCFKLLGRRSEGGVHLNFARGHQYMVSTPVTAVCRSCGTLNELHKTN